jgi:hypothetical protein
MCPETRTPTEKFKPVGELGLKKGDRLRVGDRRGLTFRVDYVDEEIGDVRGQVFKSSSNQPVDSFGWGSGYLVDMSKTEILKPIKPEEQ